MKFIALTLASAGGAQLGGDTLAIIVAVAGGVWLLSSQLGAIRADLRALVQRADHQDAWNRRVEKRLEAHSERLDELERQRVA